MSQRFIDTNREAIQRFVEAGGENVELNDIQQKLLDRWRYADNLIRESFFGRYKLREDIATAIMVKFEVARDTAFRDIVNAEAVFSSSAPLNKKYWIHRRIEWICDIISKLTAPVLNDKGEVLVEIDPENAAMAAKWESMLQKYIEKYPDLQPKRSPKTIVYNIQNNILATGLTVDEAVQEADVIIKQISKDDAI